ncbi:MAG: hypothetical protein K2P78_15190 [Gemmataceae bacterium]|nr:hypothetical protein [Gemmataceae bacterium]
MKSRCDVEKTLKIAFEEINLVRVQCKGCGDAAIEMSLAAMVNGQLVCPGCGKDLRGAVANVDWALRDVANSLIELQGNPDAEFQFVLAVGDD